MNYSHILIPLGLSALLLAGCGGSDHHKKPEVNLIPQANDGSYSTTVDKTYTGSLKGYDANGDTLTYAATTQPTMGAVTVMTDGKFTYVPNPDATGTDSFTYTVSDGKSLSSPGTAHITIDLLTVSFNDYSRAAFAQDANAKPLPLNSRIVTQDVTSPTAYDDLLPH